MYVVKVKIIISAKLNKYEYDLIFINVLTYKLREITLSVSRETTYWNMSKAQSQKERITSKVSAYCSSVLVF